MNGKSEKKRQVFDGIMRFLNVLTMLAMLASYAGGAVSPEKFWPLAFAAMAYPLILVAIVLFTFYWLIKRDWFIFLNVALILLKWNYVSGTFQFDTSQGKPSPDTFRTMSFNVRLFDRFNWNSEDNTKADILKLISENQPEILCIQEHYGGKENEKALLRELAKTGKTYKIHSKNYFAQKENLENFGVATVTSFPIVNEGTIVLENSRDALAIFTDVVINHDTVRVYNIHLQSILLGKEGYRVLNELIDNQQFEKVDDGKLMISRLKTGFLKRAAQAEKIAVHIAQTPYPVIVCGDFNDVPTSYAFQTLNTGMKDAFSEAGSGFGVTYVPLPIFRIDNILVTDQFDIERHVTHNKKSLSDHYAVSVDVKFSE